MGAVEFVAMISEPGEQRLEVGLSGGLAKPQVQDNQIGV